MPIKKKNKNRRQKVVKDEVEYKDNIVKEEYNADKMDDEESRDDDKNLVPNLKKRSHSESDDGMDEKGPGHKKHKPNKVKRPTAEEAIRLREAESLFHSNLFRLQIEEMLKEITPKENTVNAVNVWVDNFRRHLMSLDEMKDLSLTNLKWLTKLGIELPIPPVKGEQKGMFNFLAPSDVVAVGSFKARCLKSPNLSLDLAVIMPKKMFYAGDYLNQKYHLKRALYLAVLASKIRNESKFVSGGSLEFTTISGDPLKPVLVFSPVGKYMQQVEVFLHPIPEDDTFKCTRFLPNVNNLRPSWWGLPENADSLPSTPQYNTSIIEDMVMMMNDEVRFEAIGSYQYVKEAVALLRVWLKQRGLSEGYGAFSVFIMSMYIVHLMKLQKINHLMSSYQIVRNVWLSLANSDWTVDGPSMVSSVLIKSVPVSVFHEHYDVVFVDSTGFCNLAARVNKYTYLKVKREAELAVQYLDDQLVNSFQALFMTKMSFMLEYDHTICFSDPKVLARVVSDKVDAIAIMDYNRFPVPQFVKLLENILNKGIGNRITELFFKIMSNPRWSTDKTYSSGYVLDLFMIGLKLNSESSLSLIDKGPEANLPQAAEFRSFWKDKSELRRFQDGTVCESVVWDQEGISIRQRRLIIFKIIKYLLNSKLDIGPSDFYYIADQISPVISSTIQHDQKVEENSNTANSVLEELSHQLRDLPDLPLSIVSVHCISSVYRFTDPFPPVPARTNHMKKEGQVRPDQMPPVTSFVHQYASPIDLVVQLEFSRRWPNEIAACRRLMASFLDEIAFGLLRTNNITTTLKADHLIIYKDGYAFRMFLGYSKEIALLKKKITTEGVEQYRDTPESIEIEKKFINLPKISGALKGLSQEYPAFGTATCLAKRWLSAQLLDNTHFPSIIVELLVALLFHSPQPYTTVIQPQTAFLRFLNLLATTNWHIEPIIVNFGNLLTQEQITSIEKVFTSQRETLPAMFVASPYDLTGKLWTQKTPTLPTLVRVAKLASASLQILEFQLTRFSSLTDVLEVFRPPMDAYDCVIKINPLFCARRHQGLIKMIKWDSSVEQRPYIIEKPYVDFDPVQCYLKELRENYGDYALFFHDTYGGCEIGVLFKPTLLGPKEFKVSCVAGHKPTTVDDKLLLELNIPAIINDFSILGEGIVEKIEKRKILNRKS